MLAVHQRHKIKFLTLTNTKMAKLTEKSNFQGYKFLKPATQKAKKAPKNSNPPDLTLFVQNILTQKNLKAL